MAKKKKKTKLETFAEAAEELNQVLGLEPPIETEGASVNELAGKIREASELLYEDDEITDATAAVIADLTEVVDELDEQEEGEEEVQDAEVVEETEFEESEEEDEEELTLEDLREEVEGLHKRKDMRLLVEEIDLFEPLIEKLPDLKSGSALKGAMLKILGAESTPEPKAKKSKAPKSKSQTGVIREALSEGKEEDEIVQILNDEFGKGEAWAKSRYGVYERAYGVRGENDDKVS